ncbi:MAG: hypothetical protein AB1489_08640 [Acidobacteriota bacterium]
MDTTIGIQALAKRYNDCARRFKILYALSRHYPSMGLELSAEDITPPTDLNLVFGKLNVLRKLLESPDPEQISTLFSEVERDLGLCWGWFEGVDRKLTPFQLRTYCEKNKDLPVEHVLLLAQFLLNKVERTEFDQGKIDYLLTQSFCVIDETGVPRLRVPSEQALKDELLKLLPEHLKFDPPGLAITLGQCDLFLTQVMAVNSFEDLIAGDYINKGRQLKNMFGPHFYNAGVLAKCVQLSTIMRQKFSQLYKIENEKIRKFSQCLINTGNDVVQLGQCSGDITAESAMEFSEKSNQLLNADYGSNNERLHTFLRIREMLAKTIAFYGLDPDHASAQGIDHNALDEDYLDNKLTERQRRLRELLISMPERSASSVQVVELERSHLVLSSWEKEALLRNQEDPDLDIRSSCELLGRAAALIAEINETYAYYRSQTSFAPHLSDTHLMTVNYYIMQAHQLTDELEELSNRMREKGRIEKACDLSATRHKLLDTCWKIKV